MSSYTLGLDIGSNSIGWTLLQNGKKPSIIDIGVRVFPEGVDRDTKGLEKSKNATRREARGSRRNRGRGNQRRNQLVKTLQSTGLLPEDKQELQQLLKKEPYQFRAKGLDEKLEPYEFGRVLFHINQRRGFKSNRKTGKANENNKVAKEAGQLQQKIEQAGCRTLGEYFASVNPGENRIREQYTFRSMYEKEFDNLWDKQSEYYPKILTGDLRKKVRDEIIFYQRPLKPTDDLIGNCELEKDEKGNPLKRCPRGDWYAGKFRILQDVNNLKIQNPDGSKSELTGEQRQILLKELGQKKEMKFDTIRRKLGLMETQGFNAEYEINEKGKKREKLKGDEFNASMRNKKIFGTNVWDAMEDAEKAKLNDWLVDLDDDELIERLAGEYGLNEEQREAVLKISLPQRYMRFSRKAIIKLLEFMEQGALTSEAIAVVYPDRNKTSATEEKNRLDLPMDLRNPIVNRALFEVRKVVNSIIQEYGKPKKIKIEMARDTKGTARERRQLHFKMLENKKYNEEVRKKLMQDMNIVNPSRDDVIKYKLWEECNRQCPYTGKQISQHALFGSHPEFQVEHILPYSKSLDDSYMNKTLCCVVENRLKGNQVPYEYYHGNKEKFEELKQRVNKTMMPYWKKQKFWQKEIKTDEIISRELNDTRYICREVVKYLKQICPNVAGTRGKVTAELRYQWGFIKDRDDHRHHAIDAAVVAVTEQKHLRELARSKYSVEGIGFAPPWPHFREELAEKVKHINVSRRVTRKVSGPLHEETSYGPTGRKDDKGQDIFAYRKKLEDLTVPMVSKIVDPVVREIIEKRLANKGIDISKGERIPKEVWNETLYMKTTKSDKKVPIKKVRIRDVFNNMILLKDKSGRPYRAVAPGSNHHIEIFEYTDDKRKGKRGGKVVTMFEAVRRSQRGEPVVQRDHGPETKFVCSLSINEMVMMKNKQENMDLYRVQKMDKNKMIRFRHHTAATIAKNETYIDKTGYLFEGYKVTVDPLGRIRRAND